MDNYENQNTSDFKYKDEVCINAQRIYDTCKDKDCFSDLKVYLSPQGQKVIENAINVRTHRSELIWSSVDLDAVPFNKGFYSVNITFYFLLEFEVNTGMGRPVLIEGLASCNKTVILFGSEGNSVTYSSKYTKSDENEYTKVKANLPIAQVDVVEPIVLSTKISSNTGINCGCETDIQTLPQCVTCCFDDGLVACGERSLIVTIGVFSIVRIIREVQILIPASKFCLPDKECRPCNEEEPCNYFERLSFPTNEFFPPDYKKCKE